MKINSLLYATSFFLSTVVFCENLTNEKDSDFWIAKAETELKQQVFKALNKNIAKNVILFLGDGMSIPTLTAARVYKEQVDGNLGGEGSFLSFEKFPYVGLSRTYCVDNKVADSACSATAFLRGVKANKGTIGVNARVALKDCEAALKESNRADGIATWAQEKGKSTGFVTTTSVTDATPAGTYAYTANRDWECDADVIADKKDPNICEDVAKQLIFRKPGNNFNVIMGGGARYFIPKNETDEVNKEGKREDKINLIKTWMNIKKNEKKDFAYVWNRTSLLNLQKVPDYLLGIFGDGNLDYHIDNNSRQPSLAEMTEAAIRVLQKNAKGFFLLVEGGIIDTAHHANKAQISLDETVEFSKAVDVALQMTKEEDTLIVVTSDHAHVMSINGYPEREKSIFGLSGKGKDGLPYSILNYGNGPGFGLEESGKRHDLTKDNMGESHYVFPSGVPLSSETHGGDDVAVFANGPHSYIFSGAYEENYIPIAMAYASGLKKSTIKEN